MWTQLNFSIAYHPQTNGQIERTNNILEDMLQMYFMDQHTKWEDFLHLIEFSYNNNYQDSIKMSPFEALYGGKCHTPLSWSQLEERLILGLDALQEMKQIVDNVKRNIKIEQDQQKNYENKKRVHKTLNIGDHVYLRLKPIKNNLRT